MLYKTCLMFLLFFSGVSVQGRADVIVAYDAADTSVLNSINGLGVTGTDLTRVGLNQVGGGGNDFNSSGWSSDATNSFLQFGFTSSNNWNLNSLLFYGLRSDTGPTSLTIYASVNGGAFAEIDTQNIGAALSAVTFDLNSLNNVDFATFRLFDTNMNATGTLRISEGGNFLGTSGDLVLTGVAVPEPASATFIGALLIAGAIRARFRKKSQLQ
jgi:hypothetical protein